MPDKIITSYLAKLSSVIKKDNFSGVEELAKLLGSAWSRRKFVYICGNGGSGGNAVHLANDFNFGIDRKGWTGLRVEALSANPAVLTCLANDIGYENVFAQQIRTKGEADDVLILLSGSGNSPNLIKAIEAAKEKDITTVAVLGFDGGECKRLVDHAIHFPIDDMQISEDLQLVVGHMCMQYLASTVVGE